ncbi:MAG: bifunctional methionine sulfoxide reductase B/A protein [Planctomycetota bacterium]|nr:bifunctional methionine sulfoxide reductase B/A protein [Planctomycetota bacterium]
MKFASWTACFVIGCALAAGVAWTSFARAGDPDPAPSTKELVRERPATPPAAGDSPNSAADSKDSKDTKKDASPAPKDPTPMYSKSAFNITRLSQAKIDELAKTLTPEEAKVILKKGTEPAFCGNLVDNHKDGVYTCRLCGLPLFNSEHKFDSGTGWPSFFRPYDADHIAYVEDNAYGMQRVEILCARCGSHLGHVFDDGPKPTNLRYCLNSVSLKFFDAKAELPAESKPVAVASAYFAGGCFWGVEDRFQQTPGVIEAVSGYMGGRTENPTYKEVCTDTTGHAETVRVIYDPKTITYRELLEKFFKYHDATQVNRQGPDVGEQYRSAIFAADDEQLATAKAFIAEKAALPKYAKRKIATQVIGKADAGKFYPAEEYHQDYHAKHGGHCAMPPSDDE